MPLLAWLAPRSPPVSKAAAARASCPRKASAATSTCGANSASAATGEPPVGASHNSQSMAAMASSAAPAWRRGDPGCSICVRLRWLTSVPTQTLIMPRPSTKKPVINAGSGSWPLVVVTQMAAINAEGSAPARATARAKAAMSVGRSRCESKPSWRKADRTLKGASVVIATANAVACQGTPEACTARPTPAAAPTSIQGPQRQKAPIAKPAGRAMQFHGLSGRLNCPAYESTSAANPTVRARMTSKPPRPS